MRIPHRFASFFASAALCACATNSSVFAGNTWDGGGGSGLWNTPANWNLDTPPSTGVALTFAGNVQTSTSNDLPAVDPSFAGILFTNTNNNAFTLAGNRITLGGNITTTANTAGATFTDIINLNMVLDGNRSITTNQQSATVQHNLTIGGIISETGGARNLIKAGGANSTLTLSGANLYTGATTVSNGFLVLNNLNAIQNSASVSVATGATLQANSAGTYANTATVSLIGNGTNAAASSFAGALHFGSGGITTTVWNAPITLGAVNTRITSFGVTMDQTFGAAIGGTGPLELSSRGGSAASHTATWTLNAANNYSGTTAIVNNDGLKDITVKLGVTSALPTTTILNLSAINTAVVTPVFATLDLNGFSQTLAGLTDTGGAATPVGATSNKRVINSSGTLATLTINNAGAVTYGTTGTRINAGTIGGTTAGGSPANNLALVKTNTGTFTLAGANTYTGTTTISAGTLQFARQTSLYNNVTGSWTAANIVVANAATLALNVGGTNEFTAGNVTTLLGNLGGANGTSTTGFAAGSFIGFDTTNAAGGTFTVADAIADSTGSGGGAIGVTKLGTNTLALSGTNTYTGNTTIAAGTLQISSGGTLGSGNYAGTISNAGTLQYSSSAAQTLSGAVSGAGGITKDTNAGSTLTLTNTHSYTGATTVSLGTLQFNGSLTGAGGTVGVSGGTLGVGASANIARNVNLSSGAVNLAGTVAGTLAVTGGAVTTSAGSPTVTIADLSAPGAGTVAAITPLTITSTLRMPGSTTATLTGGTSFTAAGSNLANNSTARTLTLSGGTLVLQTATPLSPITLTNPSFETDAGTANGFQYRSVPGTPITGWTNTTGNGTWGIEQGTSATFSGISGVTGLPNYNAGTNFKWAFLQGAQTVSQTFTAATDGFYTVSFADSGRGGSFGPLNVQAQFDGSSASSVFTPTQGAWTTRTGNSVFLTAGSHTLSFVFTNTLGGDRSSTLDAVSVTGLSADSVNLPATSIAATSSSVLNLAVPVGTHTLASLNLAAGGTTTALSLKNGASLTLNGDAGNNAISATGTAGQTASILPDVTSPPSLIIASGKNVSVDSGVTLTVQSVISGGAVTKIGGGTLTLSGANTYSGPTSITAGTLLVNGSTAVGSSVTVGALGSLGGIGTIGGATTINGTHSPGNSPGIQTFSSSLTYNDGSSVLWELAGNTTTNLANPNAVFDTVNVGTGLTFAATNTLGGTELNLSFATTGGVNWTNGFWSSSYTGTSGWLMYSGATSLSNYGNLSLATDNWLDGNGNLFNSVLAGSYFSLFQNGNDIYLNYNAVPEPSSFAMLAFGMISLWLFRKNR